MDPIKSLSISTFTNIISSTTLQSIEHTFCGLSVLFLAMYLRKNGLKGTFQTAFRYVLKNPNLNRFIEGKLSDEATKTVKELFPAIADLPQHGALPVDGLTREAVLEIAKTAKEHDFVLDKGNYFAYSYYLPGKDEYYKFIQDVHYLFMHSNGLNPTAYPSLRYFEVEVIAMTGSLLNAPSSARGSLTSGGTESILMAIKTYRDKAREERGISDPEVILPITAHPAFSKGMHYFSVKAVFIELNEDTKQVNVRKLKAAINRNTILIVLSAPQYPHGIIDPIEEVGDIAFKHNLPLHVDACIGGFFLPFLERLGYEELPLWDFRVKGVTSISADVHKYGFSLKGASVILYRSDDYRKYQYYECSYWPGGLFVSPSALGTRAGGTIAVAWATMVSIGLNGYLQITEEIYQTAKWFKEQLKSIPEISIISNPKGSIIAFTTKKLKGEKQINIYAVSDAMKSRGWKIETNQDSIHLSVLPPHAAVKEKFISDLQASLLEVSNNPKAASTGTAAMYGMIQSLPTDATDKFLNAFMRKVYS